MVQMSVAVAVPVEAGSVLVLHWTVTLAGTVRLGGVVSTMVNTPVVEEELPHASVAVKRIVVVPVKPQSC